MYCIECGHKLMDGSRLCPLCGSLVKSASASVKSARSHETSSTLVGGVRFVSVKSVNPTKENQSNRERPTSFKSAMDALKSRSKQSILTICMLALAILLSGCAVAGFVQVVHYYTITIVSEETTNPGAKHIEGVVADTGKSYDMSEEGEADYADTVLSMPEDELLEPEEVEEEQGAPTIPVATGDYILPESNTRVYDRSELEGMSDYELYLARNEIAARHGRGFDNEDLQHYFDSKDWYTKLYEPEEYDALPEQLNSAEQQNGDLIRAIEQERSSEYLS